MHANINRLYYIIFCMYINKTSSVHVQKAPKLNRMNKSESELPPFEHFLHLCGSFSFICTHSHRKAINYYTKTKHRHNVISILEITAFKQGKINNELANI